MSRGQFNLLRGLLIRWSESLKRDGCDATATVCERLAKQCEIEMQTAPGPEDRRRSRPTFLPDFARPKD